MIRIIALWASIFFSLQAQAFPCFITLVKDSCWTKYEVDVNVINSTSGDLISTVSAAEGDSWAREQFNCQPGENLSLKASFSPVFWEQDKGKVYAALHDWTLPATIQKGETAWNIMICFPAQFAEVPMPPEGGSNCVCKTDDIPAVKPQ